MTSKRATAFQPLLLAAFFAGSKISLSPPLPISILVDSLLPSSRKRLVRPFCVAFFCDPPLQFAFFG